MMAPRETPKIVSAPRRCVRCGALYGYDGMCVRRQDGCQGGIGEWKPSDQLVCFSCGRILVSGWFCDNYSNTYCERNCYTEKQLSELRAEFNRAQKLLEHESKCHLDVIEKWNNSELEREKLTARLDESWRIGDHYKTECDRARAELKVGYDKLRNNEIDILRGDLARERGISGTLRPRLKQVEEDLESAEEREKQLKDELELAIKDLREIHTLLGRGDHGNKMNAACAITAILDMKKTTHEIEQELNNICKALRHAYGEATGVSGEHLTAVEIIEFLANQRDASAD